MIMDGCRLISGETSAAQLKTSSTGGGAQESIRVYLNSSPIGLLKSAVKIV